MGEIDADNACGIVVVVLLPFVIDDDDGDCSSEIRVLGRITKNVCRNNGDDDRAVCIDSMVNDIFLRRLSDEEEEKSWSSAML